MAKLVGRCSAHPVSLRGNCKIHAKKRATNKQTNKQTAHSRKAREKANDHTRLMKTLGVSPYIVMNKKKRQHTLQSREEKGRITPTLHTEFVHTTRISCRISWRESTRGGWIWQRNQNNTEECRTTIWHHSPDAKRSCEKEEDTKKKREKKIKFQ